MVLDSPLYVDYEVKNAYIWKIVDLLVKDACNKLISIISQFFGNNDQY